MIRIEFDTNTSIFREGSRREEACAILENVLRELRNGQHEGLIYDADENQIGYYICNDEER